MSDVVISIENVGKKYRIKHQAERQRYATLRDVIAQKLKAPFMFLRRTKTVDGSSGQSPSSQLPSPRASKTEDFWALKDVSFDVRQGEVVGIIGRNGAGKSTLLKILSRITEPTNGRVRLRGRVASLLEVGTGFHPELTGRENIFLNGAILGMHRAEIKRKFDEMVAFAEVEKFLDTPVKRYSSGMYVRLAFAVAAHLEPEILIVDEVLAVGDAEFQKKCLGKMGEVAAGGRTVLVVSHNMGVIKNLCSRAILLEKGRSVAAGTPGEVIAKYMDTRPNKQSGGIDLKDWTERVGTGNARFLGARLKNSHGTVCNSFDVDETIYIELDVEYKPNCSEVSHAIDLHTSDGTPVYHFWDLDGKEGPVIPAPKRTIKIKIEELNLYPGQYGISIWVGNLQRQTEDLIPDCLSFTVEQANAAIGRPLLNGKGLVWKKSEWSFLDAASS